MAQMILAHGAEPDAPADGHTSFYTDAKGNLRQKAAGGNVTVVGGIIRVPLTFDLADLVLTGIPIYDPQPGDIIAAPLTLFACSISEAWDGTTPKLHLRLAGGDIPAPLDLTHADSDWSGVPPIGGQELNNPVANFNDGGNIFAAICDGSAPLVLMVDDGNGGDPGSAHGVGEAIVQIIPA